MIRWIALDSWALMPFDIAGSTAGSSQNFASPLAQMTCTWIRASSREKKNRYGPLPEHGRAHVCEYSDLGSQTVGHSASGRPSRRRNGRRENLGLVGQAKAGDHRGLDALAGGAHLLRHPQRLAAVHLPG